VPLVEILTLADSRSSIDAAWIYMVGKSLLAATGSPALYGELEEGGGVSREAILPEGILGILVGHEGNMS